MNGSIANSAVTRESGCMLAGIGTVGATTITSGGMFAPGSAPGTMTVQGNLAFQSGALYLVQVNPSTASSANASGTATLAGTRAARVRPRQLRTRNYTIVSAAGGRSGTFEPLHREPAGGLHGLPELHRDRRDPRPHRHARRLNASSLSINQANVANALNNFFNNGGALPPAFVTVFGLTGANLGNALSQLSGEPATGGQQGGFQMTNQFLGSMLDPFVDGRSGVAGAGGPALGFAPEREELPDDIALAYPKVLKAPPLQGGGVRAALDGVGRRLRRRQPHVRRSGAGSAAMICPPPRRGSPAGSTIISR